MDWATAFSSLGNSLMKGNTLANIGNVTSGVGNLYSAFNAKKLGDKQIDIANQQNKLMLEDYEQRKRDREKINNSFASVWG